MTMLIISLIFLTFATLVQCFDYFDLDFPIIFKDPFATKSSKSYFGYSIVMYPGSKYGAKEWIRIGAPKGNQINLNISEPGTVYNCDRSNGCKQMKFRYPGIGENLTHAWIGGTMVSSIQYDRCIVCGFRLYYVVGDDYRAMGACFWSILNSTYLNPITPLLDFNDAVATVGNNLVYNYGQGQAGLSAHFAEGHNEMILGAPGIYNWAGTPFKVSNKIIEEVPPSKRRRGIGEPFQTSVEVPNPKNNTAYNLFGYSVTSGHFLKNNKDLYYVASSPKNTDYKGKVDIFTFKGDKKFIEVWDTKVGEQFGEYFGGSLASGKINHDKYDDLLVGAPYYSGKTYNEGRVYIFLGNRIGLKQPTFLYGTKMGAQFGAAIMYMGKKKGNRFGDVAVGAPFENGNTGTVYIFKGFRGGLNPTPYQIIIGKDISPDILGFGIFISKPIDMDNNNVTDVTIGAPLSNSAVFLRSRPTVVVKYTFSSDPKMLSKDLKKFTIQLCFSYEEFQADDKLNMTYNLSVDKLLGRATIGMNASISKNITIEKKQHPFCENINVTLKDSSNLEPIKASISYALNYPVTNKSVTVISDKMQQDNDNLCIRCPVLDEEKSNKTFIETPIPYGLGCGSDNKCQSYLKINISFPDLSEGTFVLGSSNYIKLQVNIENTEENAYSTQLDLVLPDSVYFRQTPSKCTSKSENGSAMVCDIANPLKQSENRSTDLFEIDVKILNQQFDKDHLDIYLRARTSSNNTNNDTLIYSLKLRRNADITIFGKTQQGANYYGDSSSTSSLTHTYSIEKYGVSSLEKLKVKIQVPFKYKMDNKEIIFLETSDADAYFGGKRFKCEFNGIMVQKRTMPEYVEENSQRRRRDVEVSEMGKKEYLKINDEEVIIANKTLFLNCSMPEVTCFDVTCNFGPYDTEKTPASIQLNMMVNTMKIAEFAKTMDMVLISSNGQVFIDSPIPFIQSGTREDSVVISSVFLNITTKPSKVALWIIILAIIIGLLLLLLLILLFIKLGFFKRTKKEELDHLIAAAIQEDKIMEIIQGSQEQDECDVQTVELDPPFDDEVNPSTQNLCDKEEK